MIFEVKLFKKLIKFSNLEKHYVKQFWKLLFKSICYNYSNFLTYLLSILVLYKHVKNLLFFFHMKCLKIKFYRLPYCFLNFIKFWDYIWLLLLFTEKLNLFLSLIKTFLCFYYFSSVFNKFYLNEKDF